MAAVEKYSTKKLYTYISKTSLSPIFNQTQKNCLLILKWTTHDGWGYCCFLYTYLSIYDHFLVFIYNLFVACFSFNWRGWYVVRRATFIHKKFYIFMEKCRLWRSFFFPRIHIIIIIVLNIYYVRQIKMGKVSKYMLEPLHCLITVC